MLNQRIELAVTLGFISAILFGLFLTRRIDLAFSSDLETFSGPRAYPGLILAALLGLFAALGVSQFRALKHQSQPKQDIEPLFSERSLWSAGLFASLLIFAFAFEGIGYILTMVPLLILVSVLCGARHMVWVVLTAIGLSAICLIIFRYGLATVLPEGVLGIDTLF